MRSVIFSILFFSILSLSAQQKSDSLIQRLNTEKSDSVKCVLLNDLCFQLCYSYPDSALTYGRKALILAGQLKSQHLIAKSYNYIGIVYDIVGDWDTSLLCYQQAAIYAEFCSDTVTLASAYNNMGLIYWNQVNYDAAIDYYLRSLELFEKIGKMKGVANTYNNISLIYWEQKDLKTALAYQHKSLVLRQQIDDQYGVGASLVNLGLLYSELDSFDLSKRYFYQGIAVKEKLGYDQHGLAIAYNDLAVVFHDLDQDDSAIYCYQKSIDFHLSNNNEHGAASSLQNLGVVYYYNKEYKRAAELLKEAEDLAISGGGGKLQVAIYNSQATNYGEMGNYELAHKYHVKRNKLKDSLYTAESYEKLVEVQTKYDTEKKDREIAELKTVQVEKDLKTAEDQLAIANQKKWLISLGGAFVILLFATLFIFGRIKAKNEFEKNKILLESKEQSLVAIFEATEQERQRIAKDLHDGIGQQLSGIKLAWSKLADDLSKENSAKSKSLTALTTVLDESAKELRQISHQMMPKVLEEMGLIPALEDMLEKSLGLSQIAYSFEHYNLNERMNQRIEITLFRVAQELMNNIIKHSGAKQVNVQLYKNQQQIILIVEDDGKGMNQDQSSNGHGFTNIKSRLDVVNGRFNLEPSFETGTVATIRVDLT